MANFKGTYTSGDAAFDRAADEYDAVFTNTPLGRRKREIVHRYLIPTLKPGMRVLELNSGTGEDAVMMAGHGATVLATDISREMQRVALQKARNAGYSAAISFRQMAIEELYSPSVAETLGTFNLVFSNFDGLNCVSNLEPLPEALARLLSPNGQALFIFMGSFCLMELLGHGIRGRFRGATQRFHNSGVPVPVGNGKCLTTYFHRTSYILKLFRRRFTISAVQAVGLFAPPTSMRNFYNRNQRFFTALAPIEDALSPLPPFNRMGDHILIHISRRP